MTDQNGDDEITALALKHHFERKEKAFLLVSKDKSIIYSSEYFIPDVSFPVYRVK